MMTTNPMSEEGALSPAHKVLVLSQSRSKPIDVVLSSVGELRPPKDHCHAFRPLLLPCLMLCPALSLTVVPSVRWGIRI